MYMSDHDRIVTLHVETLATTEAFKQQSLLSTNVVHYIVVQCKYENKLSGQNINNSRRLTTENTLNLLQVV
jgi:hypothetical protein